MFTKLLSCAGVWLAVTNIAQGMDEFKNSDALGFPQSSLPLPVGELSAQDLQLFWGALSEDSLEGLLLFDSDFDLEAPQGSTDTTIKLSDEGAEKSSSETESISEAPRFLSDIEEEGQYEIPLDDWLNIGNLFTDWHGFDPLQQPAVTLTTTPAVDEFKAPLNPVRKSSVDSESPEQVTKKAKKG